MPKQTMETKLRRAADAYRKSEDAARRNRERFYDLIEEASGSGMSYRAIAEEVGMVNQRVSQIVNERRATRLRS